MCALCACKIDITERDSFCILLIDNLEASQSILNTVQISEQQHQDTSSSGLNWALLLLSGFYVSAPKTCSMPASCPGLLNACDI